nr:protein Bouncer-like [Labrus bergylta]
MGSQRQSSLGVRPLGPYWFLTSIMLASALLLPALSLDSLTCYYCPLQHKGKSCPNITSQCLPHQRCSNSRGHYGPVYILSAQGCVDSDLCSSHEMTSYRGVEYNVSHTCCCKDQCNSMPKTDSNLKMLLRIVDIKDHTNVTFNGLGEDSCANYKKPRSSTIPDTAL